MDRIYYFTLLPLGILLTGLIIYLQVPEKNSKRKAGLRYMTKTINSSRKASVCEADRKVKIKKNFVDQKKNRVKKKKKRKPIVQQHVSVKKIAAGKEIANCRTVDLTWLNIDEFLNLLKKEINIDRGYFKSFSNNGIVYVSLQLISDTVLMMGRKNDQEELFVRGTGKKQRKKIEYSITSILHHNNSIPDFIDKRYPGASFSLKNIQGKQISTGYYAPIKVEAFKTSIATLEKRKKKSKLLSEIASVEILIHNKNLPA